jgi:hypothetical protein
MKEHVCPLCGNQGKLVPGSAVKNFVKDELKDQLFDDEYFLCLTHNCDVVYYHPEESRFYSIVDVKREVWFKHNAEPVYACYGNKITEDDVIKAIVENPLKTRKDVINHLKGKIDCGCEALTADGESCEDQFGVVIEEAAWIKDTLQQYKHLKLDDTPVDHDILLGHHHGCGCGCEDDGCDCDDDCGDDCKCNH